ncbi:MAG: 50S ribosomal protein L21 [Candidatus Thermofonsia Clade 1 bacterium]|uniref:Large ribosomal subunit protein bL21 n=1 Tax=Candidatus Thermofonsia Clade 1 bacterium TaxID=2364210 RepID=A0A2M8PZR1_9CHLR|nr:MAG: 50S ribosomal protein L21 [Candidatus Thermofonsia Clade 1 bacterium]PJF43034.1 MAG: 50S ribosomal protein L21 [Candidatus Thermofonsia Clade 1 bacterium]RMF48938.1 MAG: 50S ribosomal protein L21 [Chloroflexota bacterium]
MYAIVRTGGRQYRVAPDMVIDVEKVDAEAGTRLTLNEVLLVVPDEGAPRIGRPLVEGAAVQATVLGHYRAKKIIVWKYRPGLRYRRRRGHRQTYTRLKIEGLTGV